MNIPLFWAKSRLTSLLQRQISQYFKEWFLKLISCVQRKGFKYDIQQFYMTWHEPSGGNEEITAGLISVKELVNKVSIKDNWQKIWSENEISNLQSIENQGFQKSMKGIGLMKKYICKTAL